MCAGVAPQAIGAAQGTAGKYPPLKHVSGMSHRSMATDYGRRVAAAGILIHANSHDIEVNVGATRRIAGNRRFLDLRL